MSDHPASVFNFIRIYGVVPIFVVLFFAFWKLVELDVALAFIIAAMVAISDYFILTWLMKRGGHI